MIIVNIPAFVISSNSVLNFSALNAAFETPLDFARLSGNAESLIAIRVLRVLLNDLSKLVAKEPRL